MVHGLLVAKYAHARDLLKEDSDSFGFLSLVMPTDELMPTVSRGSIAPGFFDLSQTFVSCSCLVLF